MNERGWPGARGRYLGRAMSFVMIKGQSECVLGGILQRLEEAREDSTRSC